MTLWLSAFFKWCSEEGHMGSIEENIWQSKMYKDKELKMSIIFFVNV
jgi:hypothetical protein